MAKGYWIARVDVHNDDGYKAYAAANPAIFKQFGGRFVVRAGRFEAIEGQSRARNVVIEFPDYETALACYHSPEYRPTSRCGCRIRTLTSSSSKAMMARSPEGSALAEWRLTLHLIGCRNRLPRLYPVQRYSHGRYAIDRCGGRRPDGPRAGARHFGNAGRGVGRRAGSAGIGTPGQGCRRARRPAGERRQTFGRPVDAVGQCRRHSRFYRAGRDHRQCCDRRRTRPRAHRRHHRPVGVRHGRDQERDFARCSGAIRQYEPRHQPAGRAGQARRAVAGRKLRHRNRRNASQGQDRRAVGHRASCSAKPPPPAAASTCTPIRRAAATDIPARAGRATSVLPHCAAAPSPAITA